MKVLSLFSGIGAFEKALDNLEIPYELVGFSEIDKYAVKSYCAIHGVDESMNLGDITKIDEKALPKDIDLITYGFPCQDISLAGKQKGLFNEDGTQTRSGLFFEALRIIEETYPRIAIAENVKNLTSKKFNAQFQVVLKSLEEAGYNNYWQVLNAKDFGIPQNRERVFIVSIRKDIDTGFFHFPEGFPLELRLKDMLEDEVNEKFYLSATAITKIQNSNFTQEATRIQKCDVCQTLLARDYKDPKCVQVADLNYYQNDQMNRVYSPEGLAPTVLTKTGGGRETKVLVREATKKGFAEAYEGDSINLEQPNSKTRRGRIGKQVAQTLTTSCNQAVVQKVGNIYPSGGQNGNVYSTNGISPTLLSSETSTSGNGGIGSCNAPKIQVVDNYSPSGHDASRIVSSDGLAPTVKENHGTVTAAAMRGRYSEDGTVQQNIEVTDREYANAITTVQKDSMIAEPTIQMVDIPQTVKVRKYPVDCKALRIRKLTPKECLRLMGFEDEDFEKAEAVNSNTQLYKQAGNSIVVDVLEALFKSLQKAGVI